MNAGAHLQMKRGSYLNISPVVIVRHRVIQRPVPDIIIVLQSLSFRISDHSHVVSLVLELVHKFCIASKSDIY